MVGVLVVLGVPVAARAGDPDAQRIVDRVSTMLGVVAGMFGSLFDPRLVVVSGAISEGAAEVVAAARLALPGELDLPAPELVASELGGDVVCIGAVAAAIGYRALILTPRALGAERPVDTLEEPGVR